MKIYISSNTRRRILCYFSPKDDNLQQVIELNRNLGDGKDKKIKVQGKVKEESYGQQLIDCKILKYWNT